MAKPSAKQITAITESWIAAATEAIAESGDSFDELRMRLAFLAGSLNGQLLAYGISVPDAEQHVQRFYRSAEQQFDQLWRAANPAQCPGSTRLN
jgi:hypothetical protein